MPAVAPTVRLRRPGPARRPLLVGIASIALSGVLVAGGYSIWKARGAGGAPAAGLPVADVLPVDTLPAPDSTPIYSGLTRADSEAIAASVARQMPRRPAAPAAGLTPQGLDSLRQDVARTVTDSLMRVLGPKRQIVRVDSMVAGIGSAVDRLLDFPAGPSTRMMETRHPFRVALPEVIDKSADRSLARVAKAIRDSLSRFVQRRPMMRLMPRDAGSPVTQSGQDPRRQRAQTADAVIEGVVQPVAGDSVEAVFRLADGHDPRYAKSIRHAVPGSEAGSLPALVTPMLAAWLEHRESTGRAGRTITIPHGLSVDSAVRAAFRMRDSIQKARRGTVKPPSIPPGQ